MNENKRAQFDAILEETLGLLPDYVREQLNEVPIIVEDEPSSNILRDMLIEPRGEPSDLCGLHSGIPLTERSVQYAHPSNPLIMIFRGPIFRLAGGEEAELRKQIRVTLLHEIGHHFGFSEEDLEEIGYG